MNDTLEIDARLADWVDGRLTPFAARRLDVDLAKDPALAASAARYRRAVLLLHAAFPQVELPAPLLSFAARRDRAARILAIVPLPRRRRARWVGLLASAAAGLVLGLVLASSERRVAEPAIPEFDLGRIPGERMVVAAVPYRATPPADLGAPRGDEAARTWATLAACVAWGHAEPAIVEHRPGPALLTASFVPPPPGTAQFSPSPLDRFFSVRGGEADVGAYLRALAVRVGALGGTVRTEPGGAAWVAALRTPLRAGRPAVRGTDPDPAVLVVIRPAAEGPR